MGTLRKSNFVGILKALVVLGLIYLVSNVYQLEFEKDPSCDIVFVPPPPVQRQLAIPPKSPPDPVAPPVPVIEVPKEKVKCSLGTAKYFDGPIRLKTALATYPRSGNTWTRTLIEKATGFLTSSEYCDRSLEKTLKGECNATNSFLLKTHYPALAFKHNVPQKELFKFDRAIVVVRNPFDAVFSFYNYISTKGSHVEKLNQTELHENGFDIKQLVESYVRHHEYWLSAPTGRLIVRYEDMKRNPITELRKITDYLLDYSLFTDTFFFANQNATDTQLLHRIQDWESQNVVTEEKLQCAVYDQVVPYRSRTTGSEIFYSFDTYQASQVDFILKAAGKIICQSGYHELFPLWIKSKTFIDFEEISSEKQTTHKETLKLLQDFSCEKYKVNYLDKKLNDNGEFAK